MNTVRKRFLRIAFLLLKIIFDFRKEFNLVGKKGFLEAEEIMKERHIKRAHEIYKTAIELKGAFIKVCQYFSAQPNVFPHPYIEILSQLQDNVPPEKFDNIEGVLREEFGDDMVHFKEIDPEPLASGSLAQIHRALLQDGTPVVIKVRRPGIDKVIDTDFAIFSSVFELVSGLIILLGWGYTLKSISNLLDDFYRITGNELDFKREAYIIGHFKEELKEYPYVTIPQVYNEYTTEKIIVMEYIRGSSLSDVSSWQQRNNDPVLLAKRLAELYMHQFLFGDMVHYDPHPGNILIMENSRIALLDFGMSGEMTNRMRQGIWGIFLAILAKDYQKIVEHLDDLGFIRPGYNKYELLPIVEFVYNKALTTIKVDREIMFNTDISPIVDDMIHLAVAEAIYLPPNWAYMAKTVSTLLGILLILNPDFNISEEFIYATYNMARKKAPEIISKASVTTLGLVLSNMHSLLFLPSKVSGFVDNLASGKTKIKPDLSEFNKSLDEMKTFIVKFTFLIISLLGASHSYLAYLGGKTRHGRFLIGTSAISMLVSLVFRKQATEKLLKEMYEKSGIL